MAMSRTLRQSLFRVSLRPPTAALISHRRNRSNKSQHAQFVEVDLDHNSDQTEASAEVITLGMKKIEDAIHGIMVRRAAPDWLPFLPGYSYWVPPRGSGMRADHQAGSMIEAFGKLASSTGVGRNRDLVAMDLFTEEENRAFTSTKGWPSSAFYIEGTSPVHPIPAFETDTKIDDDEELSDSTPNPKNEEG